MKNYLSILDNLPSTILQRGKEYFQEGKVKDFQYVNGECSANIEGKEKYRASLRLNDDGSFSYHCSCPYPHLCKHVVALAYMADEEDKKKYQNIYAELLSKIRSVSFSESLEEFKGLPYKINGFSSQLNEEERKKLIILYLSNMAKVLPFFENGNIVERISLFEEKGKWNDAYLEEIIQGVLLSSKDDLEGSLRFLTSLLKEERTSSFIQRYLVRGDISNEAQAKNCLVCLSGKNLPHKLLPEFVLLLAKKSPRLLLEKDLRNAINFYKEERDGNDVSFLLKLLFVRGGEESLREEDFIFLQKMGLTNDARELALSVLKKSEDLSSYLRYRNLFSPSEFLRVSYELENIIRYKKFKNAALLIDGKEYFPDLYEDFSYALLSPKDIFLLKDFLKEKKEISHLVQISHRRLEMEFKKKKRNKEYFFYLLFLDFYQDDSLSYYLLSNEVKEDISESYWKGIWLYLLERNHLLGRISFYPYEGASPCF